MTPDLFFPLLLPPPAKVWTPRRGGRHGHYLQLQGRVCARVDAQSCRGQPCCPLLLSCLVHGERSVLGPRKDWIARTRPTPPQECPGPEPGSAPAAYCVLGPAGLTPKPGEHPPTTPPRPTPPPATPPQSSASSAGPAPGTLQLQIPGLTLPECACAF